MLRSTIVFRRCNCVSGTGCSSLGPLRNKSIYLSIYLNKVAESCICKWIYRFEISWNSLQERLVISKLSDGFITNLHALNSTALHPPFWFIFIPQNSYPSYFVNHLTDIPRLLDARRRHLMSVARTSVSGDIPNTAHNLEYADALYNSSYEFMQKRHNDDGSCLGDEALKLFCQALYGPDVQ